MIRRKLKEPIVFIVILNWNNASDTLSCLASLSELGNSNYSVLVVDNGSVDDSVDKIQSNYPKIELLRLGTNLGFAEGNNIGIRRAISHGADYVLLLNNDTVVDPQMLTELVNVAESKPQIGLVGPTIYYYDQPGTIWSAGYLIDWYSGIIRCLSGDGAVIQQAEPYKVDYLSGCGLCIKSEVINKIGLMDPRFFLYYEETDWCTRARAAGYEILVVPQASIWHKVSASIGQNSPAATYYMTRNIFLFLSNNLKGRQRFVALIRSLIREIRTITSHTLKPRYRNLRVNRDARVFALRDAILGRWGEMGRDVAMVCNPSRK